ncbi:MAG: tetratricopeptide repeat protein [Phycisphaeraceae bacterium]|nr:MAG: tetratricopeptide repeat protein [Phycisphaeraceae bacterium]
MLIPRTPRLSLPIATLALLAGSALSGCNSQRPLQAIWEKGDFYYGTKDYAAAEAEYQEYLDRRPENTTVRYGLARSLAAQGRWPEAREEYRALVDINPLDDRFVDGYVDAMYQTGDTVQLLDFLNQRAAGRATVSDHLRLGRYAQRIGDIDGAKAAFANAARLDGGRSVRPWVAQADLFAQIGDTPNELLSLRRAAYVDPMNPEVQERIRTLGAIPGPTAGVRPAEFVDPAPVRR